MQKAKEYDWKDSNIALIGSQADRDVKMASAETETAWQDAGKKVGTQIWRINNFQVEHWPKEDNGKFFDGDSYIILHTYKKPDEDALLYDLHFWIGKYSTQDEYGTAAYKTVELDTFLNDKPVQHREVMDYESSRFKEYFSDITVLKGGAKSGFKHVEKNTKEPKLFHFHGAKKNISMREVGLNMKNLDPSDVFILQTDGCLYQWNGRTCNKDEKFKATQFCQSIRTGKDKTETLDDGDVEEDHPFFSFFSDDNVVETKRTEATASGKKLLKLSDASGKMEMDVVAENNISASMFDSNDIFIYDKPDVCYVWIGKGASPEEKRSWSVYSMKYLTDTPYPFKSVTAVREGSEPKKFFD